MPTSTQPNHCPPLPYLQLIFPRIWALFLICSCTNSIKQTVNSSLCWLITVYVCETENLRHTVVYRQGERNGMAKNEPLSCPGRRGVSESCKAHHLTPTHSSSPLQTISAEFQNCIKTSLKALFTRRNVGALCHGYHFASAVG